MLVIISDFAALENPYDLKGKSVPKRQLLLLGKGAAPVCRALPESKATACFKPGQRLLDTHSRDSGGKGDSEMFTV